MQPRRGPEPRALAASLGLAALVVPVLALATKFVVEALTSLVYEIHWFETVPFLIVAFAYVFYRALAPRLRKSA